MLTKLTGCRTSTNVACDIRGGTIYGRQGGGGHNLINLVEVHNITVQT